MGPGFNDDVSAIAFMLVFRRAAAVSSTDDRSGDGLARTAEAPLDLRLAGTLYRAFRAIEVSVDLPIMPKSPAPRDPRIDVAVTPEVPNTAATAIARHS